jgi:RNA polymerase sigma-70 factor (ECF subfamily)
VQDVFLTLWVKRDNLETIVSLSAYLFTGAKYRMLNEIKAMGVRKNFVSSFTAFQANKHSDITQETIAMGELESVLETAISQLPPKCRQIFQLSRHHHLSISDISNSLNISPKTVENQLSKALKYLRFGLKEFFLLWLVVLFS